MKDRLAVMVSIKNTDDYSLLKLQKIVVKLAASALNVKTSKISADEALFSTKKAFDSFAMLELVICLEETFRIRIPDDHLDPDVFYSVDTIVTYIRDRLKLRD